VPSRMARYMMSKRVRGALLRGRPDHFLVRHLKHDSLRSHAKQSKLPRFSGGDMAHGGFCFPV